ncbi:hypothetical protein E4N83_04525 [Treponema denticola]|uniref:hypothetical protein n=1 Tax=Treponema denticola TaxID=158 RepID=UPI0020A5DF07|nr:hypothetical protein [Treponema denticola]UTC97551.1 hypothetical protein E4N83_04525 [Treponema denticola]
MKKLYKEEKYKKYNLKHAKKQNIKCLNFKKHLKHRNRIVNYLSKPIRREKLKDKKIKKFYSIIQAPEIFSFISNTEDMIQFVDQLEANLNAKVKTWVRLKNIKKIEYDAIVVLLSIMVNFKSNKIKFNGDYPENTEIHSILIKSGFIQNLFSPFNIEDRYNINTKEDGIHTHAYKDVDACLGSKLIKEASITVWQEERRCQGVQRVLLELMQNTNNHAKIGVEGEKHWWLSVNHVKEEHKVIFSFIDYGVGVFKNLENKPRQSKFFGWKEKMSIKYLFKDNCDILKLILEGKLHETVTNKHYRGKGLPGIFQSLERNSISKLVIITNDVYAIPGDNKYIKLKKNFNGTFVYWELNENNRSCLCEN